MHGIILTLHPLILSGYIFMTCHYSHLLLLEFCVTIFNLSPVKYNKWPLEKNILFFFEAMTLPLTNTCTAPDLNMFPFIFET